MVADAWGSLPDDNLKNAWKKLWPIPETPNQGQDEANSQTPSDANTPTDAEVVALYQTLPVFEQCDELDAREWFESDGNYPGHQHLNDDEIVHQVIEDNDNGSNVRESDDDEEMDAEEAAGPSHSDAYEAFQTAMNWLERQPEGTATQLVLLKRLRDMAAKKPVNGICTLLTQVATLICERGDGSAWRGYALHMRTLNYGYPKQPQLVIKEYQHSIKIYIIHEIDPGLDGHDNHLPQLPPGSTQQKFNQPRDPPRRGIIEPVTEEKTQAPVPQTQKDERTEEFLKMAILENDFLNKLEDKKIAMLVRFMYSQEVDQGTFIIKEGEQEQVTPIIKEGEQGTLTIKEGEQGTSIIKEGEQGTFIFKEGEQGTFAAAL
uniref:Cyclic nucleotide-binding domain-containing protein n=1 Tax=Timema monikensis TaxID=170555 RepID=A0A7R9E8P2_9NEOP|nr:unnamed protein product [Timema monikensis]